MGSPPPAPPADRGIDLTTLVLSAIASAAAAYITSKIWAPGTLFSAAMTPVIVALVKEGLRKPTEVVANVVPTVVPTPTRWSRSSASEPGLVADDAPEPAPRVDPDAPHVVLPPVVSAEPGPVHVYSTRGRLLRWRLAVLTGLLGFAICVVLYTVPELISGKSIGRGGDATTLWGGHRNHTKKSPATTQTTTTPTQTSTATTPTTTDETKTVTQTQTVTTPTATQTTPAPSTTAPPATRSTTAPQSTTTPAP
ncbi:MAG: hypothetical protein ABW167_09240 [Baekduia sp.]